MLVEEVAPSFTNGICGHQLCIILAPKVHFSFAFLPPKYSMKEKKAGLGMYDINSCCFLSQHY